MLRPDFDPTATAQAEYEFWRAHNDKDIPQLSAALESWTSELYGLDPETSAKAVAALLEATQHHDTRDWDQATACAERYYAVIHDHTDLQFNPKQAGELEVTWWQIHDELEFETDKTRLVNAFSDLYAEVFGTSLEAVRPMATLKARATVEHDLAEADGTDPDAAEQHWLAAAESLKRSYQALRQPGA